MTRVLAALPEVLLRNPGLSLPSPSRENASLCRGEWGESPKNGDLKRSPVGDGVLRNTAGEV